MSTPFVRNLTFHTRDLGIQATLLLTFNELPEGDEQAVGKMYSDYFPIAWKVAAFQEQGVYALHATYKNQLCFTVPELPVYTEININYGEKTALTGSEGLYKFSPPSPGTEGLVQASNQTSDPVGLGLGFNVSPDSLSTTVFYFPNVGPGRSVTAKFTPILKAYVVTDYTENQLLLRTVETPVLWTQNLSLLDTNTSLTLSYDKTDKTFSITQDALALTLPREPGGLAFGDLVWLVKTLRELLRDGRIDKLLENSAIRELIAKTSD